jgi:hypothetical protein
MRRREGWCWLAGLLSLCLVAGCATPVERLEARAAELGYRPLAVQGGKFRLRGFFKEGTRAGGEVLHVYLEGDGAPWRTRHSVASEPTSRNPLMLELVAQDKAPVLYLGRPCYLGAAADAGCAPELWTERRFAPEVVESLAEGLHEFVQNSSYRRLILIGHSGGGALAVLLAKRVAGTERVVTLAGNLDTAAWTSLHDYSPLSGSLNPADEPPAVPEFHFFGVEDENIPPATFAPLARKRPGAQVDVLDGVEHQAGWGTVWPRVLERVMR